MLPYDYEDFGMTSDALKSKYAEAGHPKYTPEDWRAMPTDVHGVPGYWDWVTQQIAQDDAEATSTVQETMAVTSLDHFVRLLDNWHTRQTATLRHIALIPEGTEVSPEDEESFKLEGAALRGFQMGIAVSLAHLGELPFVVSEAPTNATIN